MTFAANYFNTDIANHELVVLRDDGLWRHLRFKRPGTMCMHFDLITWPGYLCYTGDMGTYVFRRLDDMLEFFRRAPGDRFYKIDFRYWAEKAEATDKGDGIDQFSTEVFKAAVKDYFDQATDDAEDWPAPRKAALWAEIESDVLHGLYDDSEHEAFSQLRDFTSQGFSFDGFESRCREYSHCFLWCCHALAWAIDVYDRAKAPQEAATAAARSVP